MSGRSLRTAGLAVAAACAMVGGPIAAHATARAASAGHVAAPPRAAHVAAARHLAPARHHAD